MEEACFIGVDIGTESVRAGLFDAEGQLLRKATREISVWSGGNNSFFEQSSEEIWNAVCASVRQIIDDGQKSPMVAGIGFCATCSLVVLDSAGNPLPVSQSEEEPAAEGKNVRNVILWMDHRAEAQASQINATGHPVLRFVGGQISPEMQTPKLLWLKRNVPTTFQRAGHFFDLADFATWRATGSAERSICTLTCKWTFLGHESRWCPDFFRRVGLAELADEQFARIGPKVCPVGSTIGQSLCPKAAEEFGLPVGTPVAASLIDAHAGALGTLSASAAAGNDEQLMMESIEGKCALILGTSACTMNLTREPCDIPGVWGPYFGAVWPDLWLNEGGISAFGFALQRALKMHPFYGELRAKFLDDQQMLAHLEKAAGVPTNCWTRIPADLHIRPEFLGNRSPHADPEAVAAFVGIRMGGGDRGLVEWFLALLASLCYGLREILDQIQARRGRPFSALVISGGMAQKSRCLLQLLADISQKPVLVPGAEEPVLLGAAVLGSVAAKFHPTIREASAQMVRKWTEEEEEGKGAVEVKPQQEQMARKFHERKFRAYKMLREFQLQLRKLQ